MSQIGCGTYPASYSMGGYIGPFIGVKRSELEFDLSPPSSAKLKNVCVCVCVAVALFLYMSQWHRQHQLNSDIGIFDFVQSCHTHISTSVLLTYLLTYLLSPWCRVLLEQLTGLQLVKKFPAFHGTRRFITALTSVRHLSLSWASPIQSI